MRPRSSLHVRAFFAVELNGAVRAALAQAVESLRGEPWAAPVRWVRSENLHLTLRFLGDIEPEVVPALAESVRQHIAPIAPFELAVASIALFPDRRRPRAVAAEVGQNARATLEILARAVETGVVGQGLEPEERSFRAHITLGRIRGRLSARPGIDTPLSPAHLLVRDVVLYRSELVPTGAVYSELARIELSRSVQTPPTGHSVQRLEPAGPRG